jgi:hypothetical protein
VGPIFQIENLRLRKGERLMRRFSSKETQWNNVGSFFRLWRFGLGTSAVGLCGEYFLEVSGASPLTKNNCHIAPALPSTGKATYSL